MWLRYRCDQNREHAWGYKVRAAPLRWRFRNEATLSAMPAEFGWDLLQILGEEMPSQLLEPSLLSNLLRYLTHGRAPHKDRVCLLLLRVLSSLQSIPEEVSSRALPACMRVCLRACVHACMQACMQASRELTARARNPSGRRWRTCGAPSTPSSVR